ncbi:2-oxoacid:ferredoxin oxidoreductase subunit beta [Patescibacteria group bacterium]|nr:2-oxoacid:ferredoxin oxidoreductase subunit beta [Patescibacteria group bacterium]MDE1946374.1 2-oxoacid:ferredoxin oxidoreductase subunit beta [Patescibacteria group bacterium]MDE2010826.1 2-oxoacid:ferredoxin oxidoreductase subunit beta [Patescibacteria group bacterium]MDE2233114.1 2-oxoacid:ferredoxin oxidoreductase subunit beta [Patescibacteria group bacterium]
MPLNLTTYSKITWCPGCPNSQILVAFRQAIQELVDQNKLKPENLVAFAGIGCHGKITDYLNTNSFTSLHGRLIPAMTGAKCANPELTCIGFSGDGDSYSEGLEHLIHAARRNSDIKVFIHDNQLFALTTGQASSRSPLGFKSKTTPLGSIEPPFNPLLTLLSAGASFVARTYAGDLKGTKRIMEAAISHKGFAFVDIIQPCITFFDTRDYFKDRIYWIDENLPKNDLNKAMALVNGGDEKVPLGIFYEVERPTFEDQLAKI